ncbi:phosphatase PHLPP-like protein-like [Homarus americanus]|uniref:Phosphatase PHLPP-like protein-like n=1 Tax=Homarus americanus TaxID=6706 RepID=A0A8J5JP55_HOMAM|nr:phosphatase PHLPP-like protein-like [Homarus americanus]
MADQRGHSSRASRRGILKNMPGAEAGGETRRRAEVDLSGRHLERLPTSLFSSLHLTSINLSHNLLTPTPSTTYRKRQAGRGRRRRDRRRRQVYPESRETSTSRPRPPGTGDDGHQQAGAKPKQVVEDDGLSGDSGVPTDPVEEDAHRSDQDTEAGDAKHIKGEESPTGSQVVSGVDSATPSGNKPSPVFESIADELQAKLRLRRAKSEGLAVEDEGTAAAPSTKPATAAVRGTKPTTAAADVSVPHPTVHTFTPKEGVNYTAEHKTKSEDGVRGRHEESSSSGVEESESGCEGIITEAGGGVRTSPGRVLGGLHYLRHFQQLQVVVLARNRLQEFPGCLLSLPALARLSLAHNQLRVLPHALATLSRYLTTPYPTPVTPSYPSPTLVELDVSYNQLAGVGAGVGGLPALAVGGLPALAHLRAAHNHIIDAPELATMEALRTLDVCGNRLSAVPGLGVMTAGGEDPTGRAEVLALHHNPSREEEQEQENHLQENEPLTLNLRLNSLTGPVTLASIQVNRGERRESVAEGMPLGALRLALSPSRWSRNDPKDFRPRVLVLDGSHLKNVTELDVSDNGISSLDVSCLAALTSLRCSNNSITSITLHAAALTSLTANNNHLTRLEVRYHPRRLTRLNLARNELSAVPPWLVSSTEVTLVDVSHNQVTSLPAFLTSGHLRRLHTLSAHHNHLTVFPIPQRATVDHLKDSGCAYNSHNPAKVPDRLTHHTHNLHEEPRLCSLEVLFLHHNKLTTLPLNLFSWLNRLRVLNVSANQLSVLPGAVEGRGSRGAPHMCGDDAASPKVTLSLQELYAAANKLRDLTPLQHCRALRILHAPYNRINSLQDRLVWSWELLEELVLSGNQLTAVPAGVSRLRRLRVLKVHSNPLQSLPRLAHLSALKVVDASHCQLGRIELEELVSPGLVALDISGNTALSLDHHQFTKCKSRRPVSVVDVTSRSGRSLPLTRPQTNSQLNQRSDINHRGSGHTKDASSDLPWSLGFAEAIGRDSKLTIGQLRVPDVGGLGSVGVAALADGGQEVGVVGSLLALLPTLLQEECACSHTHTYALKYALLTALRRLRSQGVSLPAAVCAAHLETDATHPRNWPVLRLCCYGPVSATVTTTHGQPIVLTTTASRTPPSAVGECSEGMRCVLAETPTLPDPHTTELHLGPHFTAVVIASASLWEVLGPKEAADVCSEIKEPGSAAKRLLDLAQAYGTRQALSVIVVRLTPPQELCQSQLPLSSLSQMKVKSTTINLAGDCESVTESNKGFLEEEETGSSQRVKFNSAIDTVGNHNKPRHINDQIKNKSNLLNVGLQENNIEGSDVNQSVQELDRSSPSGQSQSDFSEHGADIHKHDRTIINESKIHGEPTEDVWQSVEDIYAYPNRRKKETGKKMETEAKLVYTNGNVRRAVTYYHYPRPDSSPTFSENHLRGHLQMGQNDPQTGVLAPPAGFDDSASDSEGSDSGLSGVSGGQHHSHQKNHAKSEDDALDNDSEQVTEEQFRSWEYLLARNAKLLFMRELDTLKRSNSRSSPMPTASAPDLVLAAAAESEPSGYFQRNNVRKSRLGRGTFRMIQNKLSATTNKFSTLQRFRSTSSKNNSNFHRFGSLQNLKYYQENRPRPPHYPLVQPDLTAEMQERPTLDSLELETRMHHYWHTGVTNF